MDSGLKRTRYPIDEMIYKGKNSEDIQYKTDNLPQELFPSFIIDTYLSADVLDET